MLDKLRPRLFISLLHSFKIFLLDVVRKRWRIMLTARYTEKQKHIVNNTHTEIQKHTILRFFRVLYANKAYPINKKNRNCGSFCFLYERLKKLGGAVDYAVSKVDESVIISLTHGLCVIKIRDEERSGVEVTAVLTGASCSPLISELTAVCNALLSLTEADLCECLVNGKLGKVHIGEEVNVDTLDVLEDLSCIISSVKLDESHSLAILGGNEGILVPETCTEVIGNNLSDAELIKCAAVFAVVVEVNSLTEVSIDMLLSDNGLTALARNVLVVVKDPKSLIVVACTNCSACPLGANVVTSNLDIGNVGGNDLRT